MILLCVLTSKRLIWLGGIWDCVFEEIQCRDDVSFNAMITGYAQNGRDEEALRLLIDMRRYGLRSDQYTLLSILAACSSLASLIEGKQIHPIIIGIIGLLY
ncbi:Pentatricopeptide repeat-containing protein [Artemisia annua]|uniref:Pentatricopeptide repeat-containing protein n=1 Tax=Artemisia annua TaxID=35608 RepID=A0A2U1QF22_ARTAN|nr:Pentatricopeptide repeat-containing protein [Artemisia annua]